MMPINEWLDVDVNVNVNDDDDDDDGEKLVKYCCTSLSAKNHPRLDSPRLVYKTLGGSFNIVNKDFFNSLTYPGQISYVLSTNSMTIGSINQPKKSWKSKYDDMLSIWTQGRCIRWMDPQSYDLPSIIDLQLMRTFNDTPWQSPPGGPPPCHVTHPRSQNLT